MSMVPVIKTGKRCFAYCGDETCDCWAREANKYPQAKEPRKSWNRVLGDQESLPTIDGAYLTGFIS